MFALTLRFLEFLAYSFLLTVVDRVSRLSRYTTEPDAMRLYRENIALKAQLDALERHLDALGVRKRPTVALRAAQVFAYLVTRGNEPFQRYSLSAPITTILNWATRFRRLRRKRPDIGRPVLHQGVVDLIVTLKSENPAWGQRRIREELRRMGIRVSEPTIARVLREHGFSPHPARGFSLDRVRAAAKDALWALDFFAVKTAKGLWVQVLLIIDIRTRELLELRAYDGWAVDSIWTIRAFNQLVGRLGRKPTAVVHDHGVQFLGQFQRQLRVQEIEEIVTPCRVPQMNCYAERSIGSIRRELLRHVRFAGAAGLQFFLDEYRRFANSERPHQGLCGRTPEEVSTSAPEAAIIDLEELRRRRLVRREYAHGLLLGYSLEVGDSLRAAA